MKNYLVAGLLFCLSASACASDAAWVEIANNVFLDRHNLQLNGAGVRTKLSLDVYIAALYLVEKKTTAEAVFADVGEKRIALHVLRGIGTGQMLGVFNEGIAANHNSSEISEMATQLAEFAEIFRRMKEVNKGDVIALDYLPGRGTWVSVNGALQGTIAGTAFYKTLMKIWLGEHPVQEDLKSKLLGQQ
ncbi:MAG: chalcone isomerase family protein [Gallionella sp.]